ncbi:hypothetical protein [Microcoleus sp. D3_18_C4]|uniref:hypothetical protein n=1 Tax=Microcoleus sp. D3_18_C4 TaxID=3055335 RepID=UPI002FD3EA09
MNWKRYVAMSLLLLVTGCVDDRFRFVSKKKFGDAWPLTVPRGQVACFYSENGDVIFFVALDGKEYLLQGNPAPLRKNLLPIYPITKRDPKNPPAFMSTDVLIEEGRRLCPPSY